MQWLLEDAYIPMSEGRGITRILIIILKFNIYIDMYLYYIVYNRKSK